MKLSVRQYLAATVSGLVLVMGLFMSALPVQAQTNKPIHLLVGFPPGGGSDVIARTLADKLKDELGVPVVVENKPGAGGQIAAQVLKNSPADGTVIFLSHDHTISILPLVLKNPGYEPSKDFVPVAGFATFVNAFGVSGATSIKSFNEYVSYVKAHSSKDAVGILHQPRHLNSWSSSLVINSNLISSLRLIAAVRH